MTVSVPLPESSRRSRVVWRVAEPRHRPHREAVGAFDQHQVHGSLAAQLQRQQTVELERGRQQRGGNHRLAEAVAHLRRIVVVLHHRGPRGPEVHQLPAERVTLEDEAAKRIGLRHAGQATRTGMPSVRIFSAHCAGAVSCTEVPFASTATVTGMSFTSNS